MELGEQAVLYEGQLDETAIITAMAPPWKSSRKKSRRKTVIAVDLFSGAGGFSEGLESAGIRVAVSQELHPQPALTHAFNHPNTALLVGDIRKVSPQLL